MKFLKMIHDFEFTVSGGWAVYFLLCVAYVTVLGIYETVATVISWF